MSAASKLHPPTLQGVSTMKMNATFFPSPSSLFRGQRAKVTRFPDEGRREKRERDKGEGGEGRYKAHCCATVAHCTKVSPKFANLRFLLECDKDAVKERHRIIFLPSILLLLLFFSPFSLLHNILFALHPLFPYPYVSSLFFTMTRGSRSIFLFQFVVAREEIKRKTVDDDNNNHRAIKRRMNTN